jgi:hypothetical protein
MMYDLPVKILDFGNYSPMLPTGRSEGKKTIPIRSENLHKNHLLSEIIFIPTLGQGMS